MKRKVVLLLSVLSMVICLSGCNGNAQETEILESNGRNMEESIEESVETLETELVGVDETSSKTEKLEEIDYSIPEEFVDYRKFIGKDVSVLNTDTSSWNYDHASQELWGGSFYGHKGIVSVELGWDDKTIIGFFLVLDNDSKISEDEREELNQRVMDIFGGTIEENMISFEFSGNGDYSFQIPKTLEQESVCLVTWNDELRSDYMNDESRPKPEQSDEIDEVIVPKSEPQIGMTAEEVCQSTWGEPQDINKTTYSWGVKEQWCYSGYRYIYFEDGVVTAIQE